MFPLCELTPFALLLCVHCAGIFWMRFLFLVQKCLLLVFFSLFDFTKTPCLAAEALAIKWMGWVGCVYVFLCVTWGWLHFISSKSWCEWNPFMMQLKPLTLPSIFNQVADKNWNSIYFCHICWWYGNRFYTYLFSVIITKVLHSAHQGEINGCKNHFPTQIRRNLMSGVAAIENYIW